MKKANMEVYSINNIIARITKEHEREHTQYARVIQQVLLKVNDETKRLIIRIKKRFTSKTTVDSNLVVKRKGRKDESRAINEGILDWIKSVFFSLINYVKSLSTAKNQLESIANKMGV